MAQITQVTDSGVSTGVARVNGAELYYKEAGKGASILLIAGGTGDADCWFASFDRLALSCRVLTIGAATPALRDHRRAISTYTPKTRLPCSPRLTLRQPRLWAGASAE